MKKNSAIRRPGIFRSGLRRVCLIAVMATIFSFPCVAGGAWIEGNDIQWDVTTHPDESPPLSFSIFDIDFVPDVLVGWQLRAETIPAAGATSTLHFATRTLVDPPDYLLTGRSGGLGGAIDPTRLFDDDTTFQ